MSDNVFDIEEHLRQIYKDSIKELHWKGFEGEKRIDIFELDKNIDKEIDYILSKKSKCYEVSESKENNTNKKFHDEMEIAALAIEYTQEANNMIGKYQSAIIGPAEDVNLRDFFIFRGLERFKNSMFIELKKLLDYFLK
jgi:hypothetical protein